jgi:hypothetical protein
MPVSKQLPEEVHLFMGFPAVVLLYEDYRIPNEARLIRRVTDKNALP